MNPIWLGIFMLLTTVFPVDAHEHALPGSPTGILNAGAPATAPLSVHQTVQLDEKALAAEFAQTRFARPLTFAELVPWAAGQAAPTADRLRNLVGTDVVMLGFMRPCPEAIGSTSVFWLSPSTEICCYGPLPDGQAHVLVNFAEPLRWVRYNIAQVAGRFSLNTATNATYAYCIDALSVDDHAVPHVIWDDDARALQTQTRLFPWASFGNAAQKVYENQALASLTTTALPASLTAWAGTLVTIEGFLVRPPTEAAQKAGNPWRLGRFEQKCHFVQAQPTNAITLNMRRGREPALDALEFATFAGRLRMNPGELWDSCGIFELDDALLVGFAGHEDHCTHCGPQPTGR